MEEATANRTIAATQMNATSSRAHTVVTIVYTSIEKDGKGVGKNKGASVAHPPHRPIPLSPTHLPNQRSRPR